MADGVIFAFSGEIRGRMQLWLDHLSCVPASGTLGWLLWRTDQFQLRVQEGTHGSESALGFSRWMITGWPYWMGE